PRHGRPRALKRRLRREPSPGIGTRIFAITCRGAMGIDGGLWRVETRGASFSVSAIESHPAPAPHREILVITRFLNAKPRDSCRGASVNRGPFLSSRERLVAPQSIRYTNRLLRSGSRD